MLRRYGDDVYKTSQPIAVQTDTYLFKHTDWLILAANRFKVSYNWRLADSVRIHWRTMKIQSSKPSLQ